MTPGSSVGFGLGDEQVALDAHGRSTGMTGLPAGAAAQHVAGSAKPTTCPARGAARTSSLTHRGVRLGRRRGSAVTAPPVVASGLTPGRWGSRKATFGLLPMLDPPGKDTR